MHRPARSLVALTFALSAACSSRDGASLAEPVVYDADDRVEVFEASEPYRSVAESAIAMLMDAADLDATDPSNVVVTYATTLGEAEQLCAGERFADQIEPGSCSGTLIDDRHILTAGHCTDGVCDPTSAWVLGFRYVADGVLATLTSDDVYTCARVVAYRDDAEADYAVVELDRPVVGHTPAVVARHTSPLAVGTSVTLIGHPEGIPEKVAPNGTVVDTGPVQLTATVDAFAGNSGSGVFDTQGRVVAILDAGNDDYVPNGGCFVVNVLDASAGDGETLTYADVAIDALCAGGASTPLCGSPGEDAATTSDAGTATGDAGRAGDDAAAGSDDGGAATPRPSGSCGCHATAPAPSGLAIVVLLGLLALTRSRSARRRARGSRRPPRAARRAPRARSRRRAPRARPGRTRASLPSVRRSA